MMAASRGTNKKPAKRTTKNNKTDMYNKLLDMVPGWAENSLASGTKFVDVLTDAIWKVSTIELSFVKYATFYVSI